MCPATLTPNWHWAALTVFSLLAPQVLVEGYDGQLPKLDMYYLLRKGAHYTTGRRVQPRAHKSTPQWLLRFLVGLTEVRALGAWVWGLLQSF